MTWAVALASVLPIMVAGPRLGATLAGPTPGLGPGSPR